MKKVQFLHETELGTGVYGATHLADITVLLPIKFSLFQLMRISIVVALLGS